MTAASSRVFSALFERLLSALEARGLKGKGKAWQCPAHEDKRASLSIDVGDDGRVLVKCHAGCRTADVLAAIGLEEKHLFPEREKRRPAKKGGPTIEYVYLAADGSPLMKKLRFEHAGGKSYAWQRRNGDGWKGGLDGTKAPLYRLPDVLSAVKGGTVVQIAEGEKCADALAALGFTATTAAGGAGDALDAPGLLEPLRGADVILWPDLDKPGEEYVARFARKLSGIARRVRVVSWGDGYRPEGFDVADYIAGAGKREDFPALLAGRITAAAECKVPAPESAAVLLRDVLAFIRRYVVLTAEQAIAVALWTLHTWAIAAADLSPYLSVSSAVMRAGKTRLLESVELLVSNPWRVVQPSEAVLFRKLGQGGLTLLFDEVDAVFGRNVSDAQEGIRAVLNTGFQRGATVPRCIDRGQKIEEFHVFGAKLLAGIGLPPPTVRDRSFVIEMKRKKRTEAVSRFRRRDAEALAAPLRERLERWAASAVDALRDARPDLPEKLGDRAQDGAEPLLAIADAAGAEWPDLARKALVSLAGEDEGDEDEQGVRLLGDVRAVLELLHRTDGEITTAALLAELHAREESPWKKYGKEREPLEARGLSRLLRPFGIRPRSVRQGESVVRGYAVSAFSDPFERYLSPPPAADLPATVLQPAPALPKSDFGVRYTESHPLRVSTNEDGPCSAVADKVTAEHEAEPLARRRERLGL